jgi:hypothetical protein
VQISLIARSDVDRKITNLPASTLTRISCPVGGVKVARRVEDESERGMKYAPGFGNVHFPNIALPMLDYHD